jgi:hypothetical protein
MVLRTTLFFHTPNLSLHFNLSKYALWTYWFWHFHFYFFLFLNVFYVNINILAKKNFIWLWMLMSLHIYWFNSGSHSHAHFFRTYFGYKITKSSPKIIKSYSFNKLWRSEVSSGRFLESFGLPLMVLQIQQETL